MHPLPMKLYGKAFRSLGIIEHDQYPSPLGRLKGYVRQLLVRIGFDPRGLRDNVFRRMRDDIISRIPFYRIPVDGKRTQTTIAAAAIRVRLPVRVGSQIPFYHDPAPV